MGLGMDAVEVILREHIHKPISGDVLLIGRQTVYFSPEQAIEILRSFGLESRLSLTEIEIDRQTINRKAGTPNIDFISDRCLFHMLGVKSVQALDCSDYEGAEVIHDLTTPLPSHLQGIADFVVDGSTLDNTFNPALTLQNLVELLRPGGRILLANMLSNHHEPYNMLPPLWYLDYFTVNHFLDCKVYILVMDPNAFSNAFCIDLNWLLDENRFVSSFTSPHQMAVIVFAEKGVHSTSNVYPIQQHYRSEADWKVYRKSLANIKNNPRPHVLRSRSPLSFRDVRGGHLFMNNNFEMVDSAEEFMRMSLLRKD